jgi:membrane-bound serine protease (ClpP class)
MPTVLTDPTLVYLLFIVGLWLAISAVYMAGTGILEVAAFAMLGFALFGMANMSTNWASVALLVLSMGVFLVIPFISPQHARWAELALLAQGAGSIFFFKGAMPNPLLIAGLLGVAFAYNHYLLVPMMRRMRELPLISSDMDDMHGAEGRVVSPAAATEPATAHINSELWTVRSAVSLESGDIVRVIAVNGLELEVERIKQKHPPQPETVPTNVNGTAE